LDTDPDKESKIWVLDPRIQVFQPDQKVPVPDSGLLLKQECSIADPGCFSPIPDPNFSITDPGSRVKKIQDPGSGSASKNLSIFYTKTVF
jgi:hypothetical protein